MRLLLLLFATCLMTSTVFSYVGVRPIWALNKLHKQFDALQNAAKSGNEFIFLQLKNVDNADDSQKVQKIMDSYKEQVFIPISALYISSEYTIVGTYAIKYGFEFGPRTFQVEMIEDYMSPTNWKIQNMTSDNQLY